MHNGFLFCVDFYSSCFLQNKSREVYPFLKIVAFAWILCIVLDFLKYACAYTFVYQKFRRITKHLFFFLRVKGRNRRNKIKISYKKIWDLSLCFIHMYCRIIVVFVPHRNKDRVFEKLKSGLMSQCGTTHTCVISHASQIYAERKRKMRARDGGERSEEIGVT